MPACHLRHDRARRKRFRDDPPFGRVTPPTPATNATANLDAPSRRGSVNYMVDHICEPMPSTGSHFPNYAARCKMGERHRLHPIGGRCGSNRARRAPSAVTKTPLHTTGLEAIDDPLKDRAWEPFIPAQA